MQEKNKTIPESKLKKIILIHGNYRSGKDYTADKMKSYLNQLGLTVEVMSFADPMKEILTKTLNLSLDDFNDFKNRKCPLIVQASALQPIQITNFRQLIQNFGTEAMKPIFGEDIWAKLLYKKALSSSADIVLIPDFRFKIEYIKNSYTVDIINKDAEHDDQHRSENELADFVFQYTIDNTGQPDVTPEIKRVIDSILAD